MEDHKRARKTYMYDCLRGPFDSIVFTRLMTLALLIAIRHYEAPGWAKSMIQGAENMGRLITPITLVFAFKLGMKTAKLVFCYMLMTGLMLACVGFAPGILTYTLFICLAYILMNQTPQLMLQIYARNYSKEKRGTRVSTMFTISLIFGVVMAYFLSKYLDFDVQFYRYEFILLGVAAVISGIFAFKMPSEPLNKSASSNAWENFSILWRDKLFGWMVLAYILLGFGNSMIIPVRVEYMANPEFKINASNLNITLINIVIQGISMILSTKAWGYIFDKYNFITTRLLINGCFIISYLTFFISDNLVLMGLSMVINGFAVAGGMIVWGLWVTKISGGANTPAYMSAHAACSGIKGIIAPHIAYWVLGLTSPLFVGISASVMMVVSCWMFFVLRKHPRIS